MHKRQNRFGQFCLSRRWRGNPSPVGAFFTPEPLVFDAEKSYAWCANLGLVLGGDGSQRIAGPVDKKAPDTAFRWSAEDQQWIFNINTKNLAIGNTHYYRITLNDGSVILFHFGLK